MILLHKVLDLEERIAHLDTQGLGLVGPRHGTTVVIAQHNNRFSYQVGPENPLAGSEEIVAVGQGEHEDSGRSYAFLITQVTTPQIKKSLSGPTGMGLNLSLCSLQGSRRAPSPVISTRLTVYSPSI